MIRPLVLAAAASVLALPFASQAQGVQQLADPAFADFQQVCWASGGDYVNAVKTAADTGWTDADVVANEDAAVSLTDKAAKSKTEGDQQLSVLITRGLRKMKDGSELKVATCKVSSNKPDAGLIKEGQAWIGAPPDSGDATLAVYFVKPGVGPPDHVGQAGSSAALAGGGLGVLKFQLDKDSTTLDYQVYSK